ncbi:hypothetical protein ACJMK2_039055 [Sinanodonta woodiana]|uniref:L-Fucosyltransferase n=1 Tax=Sinanodonta woodiana TaxID=1069815 RepID=A0ABD3WCA0_SINWO
MVDICGRHLVTSTFWMRRKQCLCVLPLMIVLYLVLIQYTVWNNHKSINHQTKQTTPQNNGVTMTAIPKVLQLFGKYNTARITTSGMPYNLTQVTERRPNMTPITSDYHKNHFITINVMGRLGNNMFQLAALISCAKRLHFTAFVSPNQELDSYFLVSITSDIKLTNEKTFFEQTYAKYDGNIERLDTSYNWTLFGYYQSWKYFYKDEDLIRRSFEFRPNVSKTASQFVDGFRDKHKTIVGIHVRRGDMTMQNNEMIGYTTAPLSYINKSMNYFRDRYNDTFFIICSDDITWCKENIRGNNDTAFSNFNNPGTVMAMLSFCDHVIITSGTFGWWAAWLAGGEVVYFKGFPRPGSNIDKGMSREDYYPPQWIGME